MEPPTPCQSGSLQGLSICWEEAFSSGKGSGRPYVSMFISLFGRQNCTKSRHLNTPLAYAFMEYLWETELHTEL